MATSNDMITLSASDKEAFVSCVLEQGKQHYRDLPWRYIDDPYAVLVSEVMLQQTQVKRVLSYWPMWLDRFPTIDALAASSTAAVLESWQGLGYNRRALAMKRCAEYCSAKYAGKLPETHAELVALDGIGPATAAGIMAFAHRKPGVYLETNVRTVLIHHFFPEAMKADVKVSDKVLANILDQVLPVVLERTDMASWYYSLLDYGAQLKSTVGNLNRQSKSYTRQSTFEGSRRQKRSFLVRCVLDEPGITEAQLLVLLNQEEAKAKRGEVDLQTLQGILDELCREGFFRKVGEGYKA